MLRRHAIGRVAADPAVTTEAAVPGGWGGIVYFRLHGSPRKYWSSYPDDYLATLARRLTAAAATAETWCIFDNTASGAALANAVQLHALAG
jgi:uncharacterized protein YecE (DUF72 family)